MGPGTATPSDAIRKVEPAIIVCALAPDITKKQLLGAQSGCKSKEQWSQGALKVRVPGKSSKRSVDVANNEKGVQERVPPVLEPKLATKSVWGGGKSSKTEVMVMFQLRISAGWSWPIAPSVVIEPVAELVIAWSCTTLAWPQQV
jgi:hypothetical protein